MDYAHKETDKILKELENRISKEYAQAVKEIEEKLDDYLRRYEKKDKIWQKWVKQGKKTKQEYKEWRVGQIAIGKRWEEMRNTLAEDYHNANEIAKSITYGYMPEVYALNHEYSTYEIEQNTMIDTSYTIYDRQTIENILKDQKLYHDPGAKISRNIAAGLDVQWNKKAIQSVMLQALLQGESIPDIATRLADTVGESNRKVAIRNARTMTTGAENAGRVDSYKRAEKMGINLQKEWVATLDGRTRHEHRLLDGQRVDVDKPFEVENETIRFPGDPEASAHLVYNCRCTLISSIKGFSKNASDLTIRNTSKIEKMTYKQWKNSRDIKSNPIDLPEKKRDAIKRSIINEYKK